MGTSYAPLVFILSWERPLYLWACLDSLRYTTKTPCRFVLLDNASSDPLVGKIIDSFEARDLFYKVHRRKDNSPHALTEAMDQYQSELGEHFGFIESDVMILPSAPSWLEEFQALVTDPQIGMLGSLIDKIDFIDPQWAAHRFPKLSSKQLEFLTKTNSTERSLADRYEERMVDVINPPGRLQFFKTEAVLRTGMLPDYRQYLAMKELGYRCAIATRVRHRHLSLANGFDYPEYDQETRDAFFRRLVHENRKK
ncbi:MAG TPA: glycosyltransferase [Gammaproteobacteria bacterium]|nr:glycosyltransferase [Gammaproteobacteria bacterium]